MCIIQLFPIVLPFTLCCSMDVLRYAFYALFVLHPSIVYRHFFPFCSNAYNIIAADDNLFAGVMCIIQLLLLLLSFDATIHGWHDPFVRVSALLRSSSLFICSLLFHSPQARQSVFLYYHRIFTIVIRSFVDVVVYDSCWEDLKQSFRHRTRMIENEGERVIVMTLDVFVTASHNNR
jgi:hypothetical protein